MHEELFKTKDTDLLTWVGDHWGWVLFSVFVAVYLLFAIGEQYGFELIYQTWWFLIFTYLVPNINKLSEINNFNPQLFVDSLIRWVAITPLLIIILVLMYMMYKSYPHPYSTLFEVSALGVGLFSFLLFFKKFLLSWYVSLFFSCFTFWLVASIADWSYLKLEKTELPELTNHNWKDEAKIKVGVALSGGGYRAATMHAGVLSALESLGVSPTHMSTVSGGSIFGSFYVSGGTPAEFKKKLIKKVFNLKRELWGFPNPIRMLAPAKMPFTEFKLYPWGSYSRTDVQQKLIEKLLIGDRTFVEFPQRTHLLISMTDLITGKAVGATKNGLFISPSIDMKFGGRIPKLVRKPHFIKGSKEVVSNVSLSKLVTASGAFPVAFPSVELQVGNTKLKLADGGLMDNTGIGVLQDADFLAHTEEGKKEWKLDLILSSDGGQLFRPDDDPGIQRFVDVIHAVSSVGFVRNRATARHNLPVIHLSPSNWLTLTQVSDSLDPAVKEGRLEIDESINSEFELSVDWDLLKPEHFELLSHSLLSESQSLYENELEKTAAVRNQMGEAQKTIFEQTIMKAVLNADLKKCIKVFLETSTLEDQLDKNTVEALYQLGKYLVYLRWEDIKHHMY